MQTKIKEPVRLRSRKTRSGLESLYLDIYFEGKREYEYLHLYLIPEKNKADRMKNAETMALANDVLAKRLVEIRNGQFGFRTRKDDTPLLDFAESVMNRRELTSGSKQVWRATMVRIREYDADVKVSSVDAKWCEGFKSCLSGRGLNPRTSNMHLARLKTILSQAVKDEIIVRNPMVNVRMFQMEDGERSFLTVDELRQLVATPAPDERIRRPFLFSCLTGLRYSDVRALRWEDVGKQGEFVRITFRQKKTRGQMYLDVSPQAAGLMGEKPEGGGPVFDVFSIAHSERVLQEWTEAAGITKHITFHCGRHTFATMMLDLGTDIYTVSKLLGHADIGTTQIYAKVLDKNRQAAVSRIPELL